MQNTIWVCQFVYVLSWNFLSVGLIIKKVQRNQYLVKLNIDFSIEENNLTSFSYAKKTKQLNYIYREEMNFKLIINVVVFWNKNKNMRKVRSLSSKPFEMKVKMDTKTGG